MRTSAKKPKAKARGTKTKALAKWDAELAAAAEAAAAQEANTGGGQFFSTRGGTLSINDAPVPNNEMAVVIVDSVLENTYYADDFDPDSPQSPDCYAFGRDEGEMSPHPDAGDAQAEACADCEFNKFGSAERGRGKACRNRRRLALLSAGTLDRDGDLEQIEEEDHYVKTALAYLGLPPTSINGYGAYVKQVASTLRRPPHAVFTKIGVVDDPKTQHKIVFELLGPVPDELVGTLIQRHNESRGTIEFPYQQLEEPAPKSKRGAKRGKAKRGGRTARKY